jgi:hypothetical protein
MATLIPIIARVLGRLALPIISKLIGSGFTFELKEVPDYNEYKNVMLKRMIKQKYPKHIIEEFKKAKTNDDLQNIANKLKGALEARLQFYINTLKDLLVAKVEKTPEYKKEVAKDKKKYRAHKAKKAKDNVQSVVFDKDMFTVAQAKAWLKKHKYKYGKVDKKANTLRFRQQDPETYSKYRTKRISDGILFVLGFNERV